MALQDTTTTSLTDNTATQGHDEQPTTEDPRAPVANTTSSARNVPGVQLRDNFPLPRELRDYIYSYLLDSKHTRIKRAHVGDRAYKFHTSILGVNRQMHDEAEEYLYKHNTFIVISHQFSVNDVRDSAPEAPWVAQLHDVEFVHRILDVHLSNVPHVNPDQAEFPRSHWVFLSHDLDSYCRVASLVHAPRLRAMPKLIIDDSNFLIDCHMHRDGLDHSPDHMAIEFRSHRYLKISCELQASLLVPIRRLMRPSLLVSISGDVLDHTLARKLEVSKDSNLACYSAIGWNDIEGLGGVKATADVSALAGELAVATKLYEAVLRPLQGQVMNPQRYAPDLNLALYSLWFSTLLTKTNLHRQEKNFTGFARTVARLLNVDGAAADEDRGPIGAYIFHQHMLTVTVSPSEEFLPPFPPMTIAECIERLSVNELCSHHQAHDVAILKTCADQKKIFTPEDLPVASCSFYAGTGDMLCFGQPVSKPDHIIGYLDVIQLRALGKGMKEWINKLQKECGWGITRFEDYDEEDS